MTSAAADQISLRNSIRTALLQRAQDRQALLRRRELDVHSVDERALADISDQEGNLARMLVRAGGNPHDLTFEEMPS